MLNKIQNLFKPINKNSDGYHTFDELYDHRITLYIALCKLINHKTNLKVWKSRKHSDKSVFKGWFILGINDVKGVQITYHLPNKYWSSLKSIRTYLKAPEFDGHTSEDVLNRLMVLSNKF